MPDQHFVVTGGTGGLGKAVCLHLAAAGARVSVLGTNQAAAHAVVAQIARTGGTGFAVTGDITTREGSSGLVEKAVSFGSNIDGLVNCAGVFPRKPLFDISDEDWDFSFAVNVRGLYNMSVAAIANMKASGTPGRIVNVASIDALKAHPKNAHYAAMKAAVVSLTKSMALACAPDGILINGVAPAAIATEKAKAADWLPEIIAQTPIGRAAEPQDIAEVIAFLLSDKNRYMVGETIAVSGGYFIA